MKSTHDFCRILVLAAIGLGALYMMHLLAQDYNKIRKPVMKLARFIGKRDVDAVIRKDKEVCVFRCEMNEVELSQ